MGQPAGPTTSSARTPTATAPVDQHALHVNQTEILVLAIGILFLVSQLVLIIWLFVRPSARRDSTQRNVALTARGAKPTRALNDDENDGVEGLPTCKRDLRQSSTSSGRSRLAAEDGHLHRQRRRSSGFEMADLRSPFSSPETDSGSSDCGSVRSSFREIGLRSATLAFSKLPQSPRRLWSPLGSPGTESDSSSGNGRAPELGRLPVDLSPRSPRVVPIDQATISAILRGEMDRAEGAGTPPISLAAAQDGRKQVGGFDDPLGVNRRGTGLKTEDGRDGDERPRGRKRSDTR